MMMRIVIAGGQAPSRSALRLFLHNGYDLEVVGEAADSEELLAEVQSKDPNVVLLEWKLPGEPTVALLPVIRDLNSRLVVIVLSGRPELEQSVLGAGADGFFNLGDPPIRLLATLQSIQRGVRPE